LELLLQQRVRPSSENQIRPSKGLIAKVVLSKDLEPAKKRSANENARDGRGRFLYLYFQSSEVGRVKWHISEECFCRGFKLKLLKEKRVENFAMLPNVASGPNQSSLFS
jgi:hypothetical protein